MTGQALSQPDIQIAQLLIGVTTAVFIGSRFLPPRYRQLTGRIMTGLYLIGVAVLLVYVLYR